MTKAEQKAIHFVLLLLAVSTLARFLNRPSPLQITTDASAIDGLANPVKSRKSKPTAEPRNPPVRLDPNRATAEELDRLPGIGPAVAERIVAERTEGPFNSVVELSRVKGITRRKAIQLAPHLTLPLGDTMPPVRAAEARSDRAASDGAGSHRAGNPVATGPAMSGPVNLNRATAAELEAISGIGPALAGRIVAARTRSGGFRSWAQVDSVPGIGPALLTKIKAAAQLGPR